MPIGSLSVFGPILNDFCSTMTKREKWCPRVLDLGMGSGVYGVGIRQWFEFGVGPRRAHLTGVEAWEPYRNPNWDHYDTIVMEPIEDYVLSGPFEFDCILLLDVVEHFERDVAEITLTRIQDLLAPGGLLYCSTPGRWFAQEAAHGNEYERHRSAWTAVDFRSRGFRLLRTGFGPLDGQTVDLACGNDENAATMICGVWSKP